MSSGIIGLVVESKFAKLFKNELEKQEILNKKFQIMKLETNLIAFPCILKVCEIKQLFSDKEGFHGFKEMDFKPVLEIKPYRNLLNALYKIYKDFISEKDLLAELPTKWEKHGDIIILPETCFRSQLWIDKNVWCIVAKSLNCKRLAQQSSISTDGFRTPQVKLLLGDNGWTKHIDNGIIYNINILKCMFSSGNITEKLRIGSLDCRNQIVVDFNAGIGYFTLPYLVKANAKYVYAIEWNPDAAEALKMNLVENKVKERCTVLEGDNIKVNPIGVADHVNLGLIPCSRRSWKAAVNSINTTSGGILHIHQNVSTLPDRLKTSTDYKLCQKDCLNDVNAVQCGGSTCYKIIDTNNLSSFCIICQKINTHGIDHKHTLWFNFALKVNNEICSLFCNRKTDIIWKTDLIGIYHIKSYAPHIDHIVIDIKCHHS